jgi:hypothetical protein
MRMREGYDQMRNIMWAVLLPHQKSGVKSTPKNIMPLPWDKESEEVIDDDAVSENVLDVVKSWEIMDAILEKQKNKKS